MRIDSRGGARGMLVNADTGRPIRWVRWAEIPEDPSVPGEYEAFGADPSRVPPHERPGLLYRGVARLRFVPAAPARPTSRRDLAGSLEEARRTLVEPRLLIPGDECDEPKCHRLAAWRVTDEVEVEPEVDAAGRRCERAVCVRVRNYCHRHYRAPTLRSVRGVENEVEVGARPQW